MHQRKDTTFHGFSFKQYFCCCYFCIFAITRKNKTIEKMMNKNDCGFELPLLNQHDYCKFFKKSCQPNHMWSSSINNNMIIRTGKNNRWSCLTEKLARLLMISITNYQLKWIFLKSLLIALARARSHIVRAVLQLVIFYFLLPSLTVNCVKLAMKIKLGMRGIHKG